jgi:hypothetical protein
VDAGGYHKGAEREIGKIFWNRQDHHASDKLKPPIFPHKNPLRKTRCTFPPTRQFPHSAALSSHPSLCTTPGGITRQGNLKRWASMQA